MDLWRFSRWYDVIELQANASTTWNGKKVCVRKRKIKKFCQFVLVFDVLCLISESYSCSSLYSVQKYCTVPHLLEKRVQSQSDLNTQIQKINYKTATICTNPAGSQDPPFQTVHHIQEYSALTPKFKLSKHIYGYMPENSFRYLFCCQLR